MTDPKDSENNRSAEEHPRALSLKPASRISKNLRTVALAGFFGVLVYSGLWYTTAFEAEEETKKAIKALRKNGYKVSFDKIELEGFPYRIILSISDFSFATGNKAVRYATDQITLISHVWTPKHWVAEAKAVRAELFDRGIVFEDALMRGSYKLQDDMSAIVAIDSFGADDFILHRGLGFRGPIKVADWQLFLRLPAPKDPPEKPGYAEDNGEKSEAGMTGGLYDARQLDFKLALDEGGWTASLTGGLMGPPLWNWSKRDLARWRDGGGMLMLDTIGFTAKQARLSGSASLTLDDRFRLLGSGSLKASDLPDLIEYFSAIPSIDQNALKASATNPAQGLSLLIQSGRLTVNGQPVQKLRPLID